ncbi:hypothetical protein ACFLTZ_05080 [Chloroflexota bacterium]
MWKSKKYILAGLLAFIVLVGSTAGIVFAQSGSEDDVQPNTVLARVAEILNIDQQALEDAFNQARTEMRGEAMDAYLQKLVDEGEITQEEAKEYKEWCESRPDIMFQKGFGRSGSHGFRGGMRQSGYCFGGRAPLAP